MKKKTAIKKGKDMSKFWIGILIVAAVIVLIYFGLNAGLLQTSGKAVTTGKPFSTTMTDPTTKKQYSVSGTVQENGQFQATIDAGFGSSNPIINGNIYNMGKDSSGNPQYSAQFISPLNSQTVLVPIPVAQLTSNNIQTSGFQSATPSANPAPSPNPTAPPDSAPQTTSQRVTAYTPGSLISQSTLDTTYSGQYSDVSSSGLKVGGNDVKYIINIDNKLVPVITNERGSLQGSTMPLRYYKDSNGVYQVFDYASEQFKPVADAKFGNLVSDSKSSTGTQTKIGEYNAIIDNNGNILIKGDDGKYYEGTYHTENGKFNTIMEGDDISVSLTKGQASDLDKYLSSLPNNKQPTSIDNSQSQTAAQSNIPKSADSPLVYNPLSPSPGPLSSPDWKTKDVGYYDMNGNPITAPIPGQEYVQITAANMVSNNPEKVVARYDGLGNQVSQATSNSKEQFAYNQVDDNGVLTIGNSKYQIYQDVQKGYYYIGSDGMMHLVDEKTSDQVSDNIGHDHNIPTSQIIAGSSGDKYVVSNTGDVRLIKPDGTLSDQMSVTKDPTNGQYVLVDKSGKILSGSDGKPIRIGTSSSDLNNYLIQNQNTVVKGTSVSGDNGRQFTVQDQQRIISYNGNNYIRNGVQLIPVDKDGNAIPGGTSVQLSNEERVKLMKAQNLKATDEQKAEISAKVSDMANSLLGSYVIDPMIQEYCKQDSKSSNTESDKATKISTALAQAQTILGAGEGRNSTRKPGRQSFGDENSYLGPRTREELDSQYLTQPNGSTQNVPSSSIEVCHGSSKSIANMQIQGASKAYTIWFTFTACAGRSTYYQLELYPAGGKTVLASGLLENGKTKSDSFTSNSLDIKKLCLTTDDTTIGNNGLYCITE